MNGLTKTTRRIVAVSIVVLLLLALYSPVLAENHEKRVLRVAFPPLDGLSETAPDGSRHGMIVDYRASRSAACNPQAVRGHFGNPALASR